MGPEGYFYHMELSNIRVKRDFSQPHKIGKRAKMT